MEATWYEQNEQHIRVPNHHITTGQEHTSQRVRVDHATQKTGREHTSQRVGVDGDDIPAVNPQPQVDNDNIPAVNPPPGVDLPPLQNMSHERIEVETVDDNTEAIEHKQEPLTEEEIIQEGKQIGRENASNQSSQ